jgi:hypothetical protein
MTQLTVSIANTIYPVLDGSWSFPDKIEQSSQCDFTIQDDNAAWSFAHGQIVTVDDTLEGRIFTGSIHTVKRLKQTTGTTTFVQHEIQCADLHVIPETRSSNTQYTEQYAGAILVDQIRDLVYSGITANYAIDQNSTQGDFASGTLSGVVAAASVGDGNLELAPSGNVVTITENATALFGTGTPTNMTAANNSLGPTATLAMKIVAVQTVAGLANSYTYIMFCDSGFGIGGSRYLAYDIWIDPSSPQATIGVDLVFTDGSHLRDQAVYYDGQHKSPAPTVDLAGLATGVWYHRKILLDNVSGLTLDYATIGVTGNKPGTYTAWIKNVYKVDVNDVVKNTMFAGTLITNPPQQMESAGYLSTTVNVVNTYDCTTATRVSPSYSIDAAKLLKSSFVTSKTTLPAGYIYNLSYSLDGGNSYTACVNNAALPNLPAGLSLAGKSVQLLQSFSQGKGAQPDQQPLLNSLQLVIQPSYVATKSDVTYEATVNSEWNGAGTTFTNTQAPATILQLIGYTRNWNNGPQSGQTLFGGRGTGPNTNTTCLHYVDSRQLRLFVYQLTAGWSRFDFAGQFADGVIEFDMAMDRNNIFVGFVYRTNSTSNYDAQYGYCVEITNTAITLATGDNSNSASDGTRTVIGGPYNVVLAQQTMHHIKIVFTGSSHQVYFDSVLAISVSDSSYLSAGYCGPRVSNIDPSNGYISTFNNFGIVTALSGTWLSPSTSLSAAGTYGGSVVTWQDVSTNGQSTNSLIESTINGGSTYQAMTNGGSIPGLTVGQSLSGVSIKFRITLTTKTAASMPQIQYFVCRVLGGFSSTGTWITSGLLLSAVGICGSTLVAASLITPPNTSAVLATSLDNASFTTVANGGAIAGINGQPSPTIDTFNLLTSSSYNNTARTGGTSAPWVWDTLNSRLMVSGGTNGLLIYGAISCKDVDEIIDLDEADNCGIVWRWTDASNYYECLAYDGSSSAGATNVLRLYKVVANVKTQIGADIPVVFVRRGSKYRVRVTMIGTAINIAFDGTTLRLTTDSSLAGPGQCGLSSVSGVGRIYNLRIQPQGDDLTGKHVWTKITLLSTDPTATPQVPSLTVLATSPSIGIGTLVSTVDYRLTYRSDNINDLAKRSGYFWTIKADGSMVFADRKTVPAPWILTSNDVLVDGLEVTEEPDLYRNRHTIKGVVGTIATPETKIGDGTSTSWALKYSVISVAGVTLNGQPVSFGVKGVDTGKSFYYQVGSNSLAVDASVALLQQTDSVFISYVGQFVTSVTRDNLGQFSGTVSQSDYIARSGIAIPTPAILNAASASYTASGNSDDLDVSLCTSIAFDITITAMSGSGGPTVQFFIDRKGVDGNYFNIWTGSSISTVPTTISKSIGPGCAVAESLGALIRVRWAITGTTPSWTFAISILGNLDTVAAGIGVIEAIEDATGQDMNVAAANALADSRLQEHGVIGRTVTFKTLRTGLAAGQYLPVFIPEHNINDASMLITSVTRTQNMTATSQLYWHAVVATEGPALDTWNKAMNQALTK